MAKEIVQGSYYTNSTWLYSTCQTKCDNQNKESKLILKQFGSLICKAEIPYSIWIPFYNFLDYGTFCMKWLKVSLITGWHSCIRVTGYRSFINAILYIQNYYKPNPNLETYSFAKSCTDVLASTWCILHLEVSKQNCAKLSILSNICLKIVHNIIPK